MNKLPYICQIRPKPPKKGMLSCCCVNVLSKNERRTFFIGIFVSVVQSKHLYHKRQESSALLVRNLSVFVCAPPGGISTCHSYLCTTKVYCVKKAESTYYNGRQSQRVGTCIISNNIIKLGFATVGVATGDSGKINLQLVCRRIPLSITITQFLLIFITLQVVRNVLRFSDI